jgi:hypothetical protein
MATRYDVVSPACLEFANMEWMGAAAKKNGLPIASFRCTGA